MIEVRERVRLLALKSLSSPFLLLFSLLCELEYDRSEAIHLRGASVMLARTISTRSVSTRPVSLSAENSLETEVAIARTDSI